MHEAGLVLLGPNKRDVLINRRARKFDEILFRKKRKAGGTVYSGPKSTSQDDNKKDFVDGNKLILLQQM